MKMTSKREVVDVKRCVRCVMPETYPGITFNEDGVCNLCQYYEHHWDTWMNSAEEQDKSEEKLLRIFETAKRKHRPYDALIGISGGKDSSYMLYLCRKVYDLNVLTYTVHNGFRTDEVNARVDKLVKKFKVPHIDCYEPLARELAGVCMRKTGHFCSICELLMYNTTQVVAAEYDVPLIIMGSSSRTEAPPPKHLNPWDPWYISNILKGENYQERLRCSFFARNYVIKAGLAQLLGKRRLLLLPNYVSWNEHKIHEQFQKEFDFDFGGEHSDCWATRIAAYLYAKKCGGTAPMVSKYSMFIRSGEMSREEAMNKLANLEVGEPPPELARFLEEYNMTREEFDEASERSTGPYLKVMSQLFNTLRKRLRGQAI